MRAKPPVERAEPTPGPAPSDGANAAQGGAEPLSRGDHARVVGSPDREALLEQLEARYPAWDPELSALLELADLAEEAARGPGVFDLVALGADGPGGGRHG